MQFSGKSGEINTPTPLGVSRLGNPGSTTKLCDISVKFNPERGILDMCLRGGGQNADY